VLLILGVRQPPDPDDAPAMGGVPVAELPLGPLEPAAQVGSDYDALMMRRARH
jgi:hypothetical protein